MIGPETIIRFGHLAGRARIPPQAQLHSQREQVNATLAALRLALAASAHMSPSLKQRLSEMRDPVLIGQAAKQVGVCVSAVRFWEGQGLLEPTREKTSRSRRYTAEDMRQLQIIAMLRKAGYGFDAIRVVLDELSSGNAGQAIAAAEHRLADQAGSARRLQGLALLWRYVERYCDGRALTGDLNQAVSTSF